VFDWNDLKHFLAFARRGSTLAAAKTLGLSQSTVHRRLTELERRLGRRLVQRDATGYRLTELGEALLPFAQRVEEAVAAFERHLASCDNELTGTLRVTCPTTVAERLAETSLIEAFHVRFPGVRLELVVSDQVLDLAKREADIAIRASECRDDNLVGRTLAEASWAVYASQTYVERCGRPGCLEDIRHHRVIGFGGSIADYPAAQWLRAVAPEASITMRSDSWPATIQAVKSGAGLMPMPTVIGDRESDLVRVIDDIPNLVTKYYLLTHRDLHGTPRVRAFFDFVAAEIKAFRTVLAGVPQRRARAETRQRGEEDPPLGLRSGGAGGAAQTAPGLTRR
jgi:DNA-binding transcriptional LysR family regulator